MSSRLKLAGICFAAAFALAACGGGGSSGTATDPAPSGPTAEERAQTAQNGATAAALAAREHAETVVAAGNKAVKDAMKYTAVLDAVSVKGSSATATANAQKVLDARTALTNAITAAEMAVETAEAAKEGVDEDTAASLDSAIMAANKGIKAAKAMLEGDLKTEVEKVTGTKTATGYPRAPAYHGKQVADVIHAALETDPTISSGAPDTTQARAGVQGHNRVGMSWLELAESLGLEVQGRRIGRSTADDPNVVDPNRPTVFVYGAIVNGRPKPSASTDPAALTGLANDDTVQGDTVYRGVTMFGLRGILFCQSGSCKIDDEGNLAGDPWEFEDPLTGETFTVQPRWYFVPNAAHIDTYLAQANAPGMYRVEDGFVRYGYWLSQASDTDPVVVNTYSVFQGTANSASLNLAFPSGTLSPTADYSGEARGIASRTKTTEDNVVTTGSGAFTADVKLTARFGGSPLVGGTVRNFRGDPEAVDSRWSVKLMDNDIGTGGTLDGTPVAQGDTGAPAGTWSATAYGPNPVGGVNQRPTGFFGTFHADFRNGRVAGGYATRKD